MGNSCIQRECHHNCCDADGYCPPQQSQCYYQYGSNTAALTAGIVIGSILLIAALMGIVYLWSRRKEELKRREERDNVREEGKEVIDEEGSDRCKQGQVECQLQQNGKEVMVKNIEAEEDECNRKSARQLIMPSCSPSSNMNKDAVYLRPSQVE